MGNRAIHAEQLSKRYHIGRVQPRYRTLRDTIVETFQAPFRRASRILRGQAHGASEMEEALWALKDLTFDVNHGDVVGIIGRNGAGKSTLLKVLSRITEPTSGFARVYGRVGSLLEVGTGFHPELTGRENISLNGAVLGMRRHEIERKFDEIVAFSGVEKFIDTPMKHFSSGMQLRLAFAVAAHLEPEILVIDEVLAVGDAEFQRKCLGKMGDVAREGRTILFVSHHMPAVERMCNKGILLVDGQIADQGSIHKVINTYLHSGIQKLGERVWENRNLAPGSDAVRLHAVRAVRHADGEVVHQLTVKEAFDLHIEFWVLKPGYDLDASLYLYNEEGDLLFMTSDFQDPTWHRRPRDPGLHRSICHIPANFMNEGTIRILVGISANPHTLHALERDAITIQIIDDLQPGGARGSYTREWPGGAVRPLLSWSFEHTPLYEEETP
jgi:lipopolysaccharide transport system ATP-binding protein